MGFTQTSDRGEGWHGESFTALENGEVVVAACRCALGEDHAYVPSRATVATEASAAE